MKILLLALDVDISASSGDAIHVQSIAKAFSDLGHQVMLLVGASATIEVFPKGVAVRVQRKKFSGLLRVLDDLYAAIIGGIWLGWMGERLIYERRFSCKVGFVVKCLTCAPLSVEINGLVDDEVNAQGGKVRRARVWSLQHANQVITVAPGLATALHKRYGVATEKLRVVSNGVDSDLFYPCEMVAAKAQLGFAAQDKIILFAGNFVDWYDFPLLLKAFKLVHQSCPDARLVLVGEGRWRERIEDMIDSLALSRSVFLPGRVTHQIIPEYVAASDVCVAPFTRERNEKIDLSPIKLFEYLAGGRSVVASDIGGLARYAADMPSLNLVETGNVKAFADKIIELLVWPQPLVALAGAEFVRNHYSWRQAATQILDHLKQHETH